MTIHQDQITHLQKGIFDRCLFFLTNHIERNFPSIRLAIKDDHFILFLNEGITKAIQYNLETNYQIAAYFDIMLTIGLDFEETKQYEWTKKILTDHALSADMKIEELIKKLKNNITV